MKKFPFKILVIIPALVLGLLLWKYGVNLPVFDEWDTPGLAMVEFHLGQLSWDELIAQHNESRKFFPRLFFLYLSRLTNWNTRYGMLASFLLVCLTSFNIYYLSKITLKSTWAKKIICLAIANLLIFSPMQSDNWLMGLQLITFVPIACITSALAIIFSQNNLFVKIFSSAILATLATFSFSNGIISWIVIFPALVFISTKKNRPSIITIVSWLFIAAAIFTVYFHNYVRPAHHPHLLDSLNQPLNAVFFFLSFFGSPLGFSDLVSSQIIGFCVLCLIALAVFYLFKINPSKNIFFQAFPWLFIIMYSLGSGVLTTAGRVSFGVIQSIESRYITFSSYAIVGLIYLLVIIAEDSRSNFSNRGNKFRTIKRIITVSMVALLLLYPANFAVGLDKMEVNYKEKLYSKACLNLLYITKDVECWKQYLYPSPEKYVIDRAVELDRLGLLKPPLITSKTMQGMSTPITFEQLSYGQFDNLTSEGNTYNASGWSILPQYRSAAHAVILAYQTKDNLDYPFAIVFPKIERSDVVGATDVSRYKTSGWSKTFSQDLIPDDAVAISAWAYDSRTARAYKMQVTHPINLAQAQ